MMTPRRKTRRGGFTLIEVILATFIAGLILFGLYNAINTQLKVAEAGRNSIERATLARSLMARISSDVTPCVGLPDPARYRASTAATSSSSSSSASPSSGMTTPDDDTVMPDAVRSVSGDDTVLRVWVSRVPRQQAAGVLGTTGAVESDQRLIIYWLAGGPSNPLGLARFDMSAGEATSIPVGSADEKNYVIAPEVVSLQFRYYDGISWGESWNGADIGQDNMTPVGPPIAIAIEIDMEPPPGQGPGAKRLHFRHVVSIPTAGGTPQRADPTLTIP